MMRFLSRALGAFAFAFAFAWALPAQSVGVGWRDEVFPNTSGQGTAGLACRVFYPSNQIGPGAPLLAVPGGHPVVLHLHGNGGNAVATPEYSAALASAGYVVVMQGTASSSSQTQYFDAMATMPALAVENARATSFYVGQLDLGRFAVIGHSMGGGNTFRVLAASSVPKLGIAFAPTNATSSVSGVRVPFLTITGAGDTVIPPNTSVLNFQGLNNYTGAKVLYLFDASCNHATMLASPLTVADTEIFLRTMRVTIGFLDTWLKNRAPAFDEVAGEAARAERRLAQLQVGYERPQAWFTWLSAHPFVVRLQTGAEPGAAFVMASVAEASIPTPFGIFGLDPATLLVIPVTVGADRRVPVDLPLPADIPLNRIPIPIQSVGLTRTLQARLSNVTSVLLP